MAFLLGALKQTKEEIRKTFKKEENVIPTLKIIDEKSKGRLDSPLYYTAYLLNPIFYFKDPSIQNDINVMNEFLNCVERIFPTDEDIQFTISNEELLKYKSKSGNFGRKMTVIAYEKIHTKKRNRLETSRLNDLVYVKFNANLMKKKSKREMGEDLLLSSQASEAQGWFIDGGDEDEVEPGSGLREWWRRPRERMKCYNQGGARNISIRELDENLDTSEEENKEDVDFESDDGRIMDVADGTCVDDLED
ncbi:uncharacterized protein LOC121986674 [Zingiber officinale]|uniref:uncharacterized protein LOC121986674 n=1 Tax=Zingiber officinale TaxID=94328 RepID=UPI001C4D31C4|nr:uncharacterized protein LOC121986674 [Zingiber officinale]